MGYLQIIYFCVDFVRGAHNGQANIFSAHPRGIFRTFLQPTATVGCGLRPIVHKTPTWVRQKAHRMRSSSSIAAIAAIMFAGEIYAGL